MAPSKVIFEAGWKLFKAKWSRKERNFVKYFETNHIINNGNWYEGYSKRTPLTNNCTETFNKLLKRDQTFYLRKPLHEFMVHALEIVQQRSTQYVKDKAPPVTIVTATEKQRLKGWAYANSEKSMVHEISPKGELLVYVFAGERMDEIKLEDVRAYENYKANNFDDFIVNMKSIYQMTFSDETCNDWINATCTCAAHFKNNMCKHILAVAYRLDVLPPPDSLLKKIETPAPKKNRPGRPPKATKALIID